MKFQPVKVTLLLLSIIVFGSTQQSQAQTFTVQNGAKVSVQNGGTLNFGSATSLNEDGGLVAGNGSVIAERILNAPTSKNVAGLGAIISSEQNMGHTTVIRSHEEQSVGNRKSVQRYYEVTPTTNTGLDATLAFNYADSDINDLPEEDLILFRSNNAGSTYSASGYDSRDASSNTITLNEIDSFARFSAAAPDLFNYGSLDLNGVDNYMDISSIADDLSGSTAFSVSFWMKPDFTNQTDENGVAPFGLNDASGDDLLYVLVGSPGSQDQVVRLFDASGEPLISGPSLTNDTWHHIAFTYNNGTTTLFVDGRHEGQSSSSITLSSNDQWSIGQEFDSGSVSDLLDGNINDVRVWTQARNQEQIRNNMFQPLKGDETDLAAYWALNNVSNDFSSNSNDATLMNNPSFISDKQPAGVFITGTEGWRMLTTPSNGETYNQILEPFWTQGIQGGDSPSAEEANVYAWDEPNQQFSAVNGTNVPAAGEAFIVYVYDDQNFDGTDEGFPKILKGATNSRTGNISPSLDYTNGGEPEDMGWNLIGNPYDATIDWDASGWATENLDASIYVWSDSAGSGNGAYLSWNGMSGTLGDGLIAPWQGFWVKGNNSNPELTFTNEVRSAGGVFHKEETPSQLKFTLTNGEVSSSAIVMLDKQASIEKDRFDAYKLQSLNTDYLSLFTQTQDGAALDINTLPEGMENTISIPLGIERGGMFSQETEYALSWNKQALPEGWSFILTDHQSDQEFNLNEQSVINLELDNIQSSKTSGADGVPFPNHKVMTPEVMKSSSASATRFTLTIASAQAVSNERLNGIPSEVELRQNYPNPFNPTTNIEYGVPQKSEVTIEVFDLLGRKVATLINQETKQSGRYSIQFDAGDLASGLYLYRLQVGNAIITKKLTLIK